MKYSIKDFAEGKIIVHSTEAEWPEFVKAYRAAGCKDYDRGYRGDVGAYISPNTGYVTGNYTRGTRLPEVNFSDLAPANYAPADFYAGRVGVRCETREEYDRLMQECEDAGKMWCMGKRPTAFKPDWMTFPRQFAMNADVSYEPHKLYQRKPSEDLIDNIPCVPFRAIFPDPWDEFAAGKAYLRVKKEEWAEFLRKLTAAGLSRGPNGKNWYFERVAAVFDADKDGDVVQRGGEDYKPTSKPLYDFSTLLPAPAKAPEPPAPYDGRGKHKVGDLFEVIFAGDVFNVGDIIRLRYDDGSKCPSFERLSDGETGCKFWGRIKPHTPPTPAPRIEITVAGRVTTATLYEDGKAVRTGTATCAPEDEFEFFTGATIAYNRVRFGQQFQPTKFAEFMALSKKIKALGAEIEKQVGKL